ncbi:unnamed protein product, partial [Ectocarpus sp. 6 AP-2014]
PAFSRGGGPRYTRYCAPCLAPISAQRGRDSGAVCVRRWRRNRLRYTKNRSNRLFGGGLLLCAAAVCSCCGLSVIETSRLPINLVFFPFASRKTEAQKTLPAASRAQRRRGHGAVSLRG